MALFSRSRAEQRAGLVPHALSPADGGAATAAMPAQRVYAINDEASFRNLNEAWNDAVRRAPLQSAFLSHEWFAAAWAWRREDSRLEVLVHSKEEVCRAALPIVRSDKSPRRLELLTVPDTQLADMVSSGDEAAEHASAFAAFLASRTNWDRLDLDYLHPEGMIASHLIGALRARGLESDVQRRGGNPYVPLDIPWERYLETRSRRHRKMLNLAANRLRRAGSVAITRFDDSVDDATFERILNDAIAISAASWKKKTGNSLKCAGPEAFFRSLSRSARKRGWFSLWVLTLDGEPVAMEYQLLAYGNVHALRSDFRNTDHKLSPGTHLFHSLLEEYSHRGLTRYYLGPGDNAYKARWADAGSPLVRARIYNRTLRGRAAWLADIVAKPMLRLLREGWRHRPPYSF